MKKMTFIAALLCILVAIPASAQRPRGRYTPPAPRTRTSYSTPRSTYGRSYSYLPNTYFGLRFGLSASHVSSDAPDLSSNSSKSGLDVGAVVGIQMTPQMPLFFETGLLYVEKGGKGKFDGNKFSYGLNYLEVPLVLKYSAYVAPATAVEPFIGGYMAGGIGGKVKDYRDHEAFNSFGTNGANFKRFDGGIRVGCGLAYEMLYAEIGYDFGLTNIGDNAFDDTHNGAMFLNIGMNF